MTKRIKLKVQRNRLPDVDILWPVRESEGREQCTIAKLIADVDHAIPLEAGDWTLDQYICEVSGFECLHYQFVTDVLKDGDNVTIRPLTTPDVKARRLGGRTQITGEGFHILDGVPYGMQPNQRPSRPGILIPSRKRRRPEMEEEDMDEEAALTIADLEDDETLLEHVNGGEGSGGLKFAGVEEVEDKADGEERPKKRQKNVHFKLVKDIPGFDVEEDEEEEDEDEDEEDDGDFDPDGDVQSDEGSAEDDDASADDSDDDSDASDSSSDVSSTSSEDSSSSDDSDASDASSAPEVVSSKQPPASLAHKAKLNTSSSPSQGAPYNGSKNTKDRNARRRRFEKVLKRVRGIIGHKASKAECDAWLKENPEQATYIKLAAEDNLSDDSALSGGQDEEESEFTGFSEGDSLVANGNAELANGDEEMADAEVADKSLSSGQATKPAPIQFTKKNRQDGLFAPITSKSADFQKQRENLLDAISSGGVVADSTEPLSIVEAEVAAMSTPLQTKRASPTADSSEAKRVRLDINGSRRAIFGALGQRTPKTQQDADRVRAKLAGKGKPAAKVTQADAEKPEEDPYSEAWRDKIILRAVDCDNPEIQLSEPPYPFKQRWDASQQRDNQWWENGGKKRKRRQRNSYGYNNEEEEEQEESYLDYGDEEETELPAEEEEYGGEEALAEFVEEQIRSELGEAVAKGTRTNLEDLPSLPADITTLADLTANDLKPNLIFAFKQLEMSQATSWAPVLSAHRTAKIVSTGRDGVILLELAIRDREVKNIKYDSEGNRVYEKFEMNAGSDDDEEDEDDGMREIKFEEMREAKLVRAGSSTGAKEGDIEVEDAEEKVTEAANSS